MLILLLTYSVLQLISQIIDALQSFWASGGGYRTIGVQLGGNRGTVNVSHI